jgi:hypothetical protein
MTEYQILSKCLNEHCISDHSNRVFIREQPGEYDLERWSSKARVCAKLQCPVSVVHEFFDNYNSSSNFENLFNVKCDSSLKDNSVWHEECKIAYEAEIGYLDIGPVFTCSRVYTIEDNHLMYVSAWFDPKAAHSGFYYYRGFNLETLEFVSKYICTIS